MSPSDFRKIYDIVKVLEKENAIKLKILIRAQCGRNEQQGSVLTENIVSLEFHCRRMEVDVEHFV